MGLNLDHQRAFSHPCMDVDTHHVLQSHTYPIDLHAIEDGWRGREATRMVERRGRKRGRTRWK
jgi:hypothetical protein